VPHSHLLLAQKLFFPARQFLKSTAGEAWNIKTITPDL
jgi:hypothetical protein